MTTEGDKIPERKGIVVIGMISSGKSTFLNSLLGINFLEANDNITTKLVTIIRYNNQIKEPKFYHLKVIKESKETQENNKNDTPKSENDNNEENTENKSVENNVEKQILEINNDINFYFIKDGQEAIGEKEIVKRISEINKEESNVIEPKYDNLFYMLETNIVNIKNEEFLKNHDFYDIPGLNEYIKSNEKEKVDKIKKNEKNEEIKQANEDMKYIKGIFQYIKNKIEREIIVLDSEKYYKPQNLQIIEEIKNYFNITLKDNLVILNKIDISNDRQKTISDCKQFFVNNIESNIFNINDNVFVPLNSNQFKNEILMRDNYEYYYKYYLNLYIEKYVRIKEDDKDKVNKSFIEFILSQITYGKKKEKKQEFINNLVNDFDDDNLPTIKKIYEDNKNKTNMVINYGINFGENEEDEDEEDQSIIVMKAFYQNFQDQINIPNYSEEVQKILNYFNNFKDNSTNLDIAPLAGNTFENNEAKALKILNDIFGKLTKYVKDDDEFNIINIMKSNLIMMEQFILNDKKIYIPFIGVSSAGKSTIINCIVGYKLFPEALNECTTRGIIIQYSDIVELYETKIESNRNYYIFSENNRVAEGHKEVREYLESLNYRYGNSESKYFYIVKTPIKCFDDFQYDDELKDRIYLIDLPGSDTKDNKFSQAKKNERNAYEKLLSISSSFIYINKGRAIRSQENQQILKKLYKEIQDSSKIGNNDYLKACYFVINMFNELTDEERNLQSIKNDLSSLLFDNTNNSNEIKCSTFNAKCFYDYLSESCLLTDHEALIDKFFNSFINQDESLPIIQKNFPKFCLRELKSKLKNFGLNIVASENCTPDFIEKITNTISKKMENIDEKINSSDNKTISQLSKIFYSLENEINLKEMNVYINSYCENFLNVLKNQIEFSKNYKDEDYLKKMKLILRYFDSFFKKDIKNNESKTKIEFKEKNKELNNKLKEIFKNFNIEDYFESVKENIEIEIERYKSEYKIRRKEGKTFEEIINDIKKQLNEIINEFTENINKEIQKFYDEIQNLVKQIKEMTEFFSSLTNNDKFKNSFDILFNLSKDLYIKKDEKNILIIILSSINNFFKSFNFFNWFKKEEEKFLDDLQGIKNEILDNLKWKNRMFIIKFDDERVKIKGNFKCILALAFSDLSYIEEKEWIQSKKLYHQAKKYLLPNEEEENDNSEDNNEDQNEEKIKEHEKENEEKEVEKDEKKENNLEEKQKEENKKETEIKKTIENNEKTEK